MLLMICCETLLSIAIHCNIFLYVAIFATTDFDMFCSAGRQIGSLPLFFRILLSNIQCYAFTKLCYIIALCNIMLYYAVIYKDMQNCICDVL